MKTKIFFIIILLLKCFDLYSQNIVTDSSTTVFANWQIGDITFYDIQIQKEKYQEGQLKTKVEINYETTIKIIDKTDSSYTIEWVAKNIKTNQNDNPLASSLTKILSEQTFIYKTDETGAFTELINWEEIRDYFNNALDKLLNEYNNNPQIATAFDTYREIFNSKQSIEQSMIKEIQLYHNLYAGEYFLNKKIELETQLPNFLGGEPFPAIVTFELTDLYKDKNEAIIKMNTRINPENATEQINEFMKKLYASMNMKEEDSKELNNFEINDDYNFNIDLSKGLMKVAFSRRTMENDFFKNVDMIKIKFRE